ncbi:tetratricopeptide repeat protein [Oceanispirochaeta sp.]|jgi:tetratricopeptide (TPR) repeat protein|uniref:tetratricopeptide repeat protein n=1 Tax=Oceanispirochaeta sp. TaxID=2035350 RepID=UPI00262387FB|nr:tetratricopeptide repeat protein [Oceanispirochaeta sp.]MDA3956471.1 tetratricopeptide repeat protein [Oceanispirochaeta sp.]
MNLSRLTLYGTLLLVLVLFLPLSCTSTVTEKQGDSSSEAGNAPEKPKEILPVEPEPTLLESLTELNAVEDGQKDLALLEKAETLTLEERILKSALMVSEGYWKEAREELNRLLEENPGHPDVLYNLALLENAEGDNAARDETIGAILKTNPDHEDGLLLKGTIDFSAKRYKQADQSFSRILSKNPKNFMALSGAGSAQMNLDNLEGAVKLLNRAIELEPDFAYLYVDRARAFRGLKKYGKAEEDYGRAIELEPDVEWHYLDRTRIFIQYFHDLENAWEDLEQIERINPDNLFANIYKAGVLDEWQRYDEAEVYYEKILRARPDYGYAHEPLAKYAYMKGDFKKAKNHFLQAYEFESRDVMYVLAAALCMEKSGDRKNAEKLLKEVIPRVTRDSIEYEMFRYYLQPGSNYFITDKIAKETNEDLRSRMYFYLGARDDLQGLRRSALASYEQVDDYTGFFESELAAWERNNP